MSPSLPPKTFAKPPMTAFDYLVPILSIVLGVALVYALCTTSHVEPPAGSPTTALAPVPDVPMEPVDVGRDHTALHRTPLTAGEQPAPEIVASVSDPVYDPWPEAVVTRLMATFLTEHPDLDGLVRYAEHLVQQAEVDAEHVTISLETGAVVGYLKAPGQAWSLNFQAQGGQVEVSLVESSRASDPKFLMQTLSWKFATDNGSAINPSLAMTFHPDTHGQVGAFLGADAERVIGWSLRSTDVGSSAHPRSVSLEDGTWRFGPALHTATIERPGLYIDCSHQLLLQKLAPHVSK